MFGNVYSDPETLTKRSSPDFTPTATTTTRMGEAAETGGVM